MSSSDPEREPQKGDRKVKLAHRVARFWWVGALRGVMALALGLSALLASGSPERLATFLALYWLAGGILTLRLAWAIHPAAGFRLASVAGVVAIAAALLVVLRGEFLSDVLSPASAINVLGFATAAIGSLRLVGAFEIERRSGHRWTIGGLVLGSLELGTGILLLATDELSPGVMITVGTWALASGTLLIVQAFRARRQARSILEHRDAAGSQPTNRQQ